MLYGNDRKYKMIAKMLRSLIQVNLPLMFYINEIPISSQLQKRLYDFFYRDVTVFHGVPLTTLVFRHATSRKMLRPNPPPPMCDVTIE